MTSHGSTPLAIREFNWRRAERSMVALGQPTVGVGVMTPNGLLVSTARTALNAATGDDPSRLTIPVMASDDHRWRGAQVGILNCDIATDVALLGAAPWIACDGLDALAGLLGGRRAVGVQDLAIGATVTLHLPTPAGAWIRLPAVVADGLAIVLTAGPIGPDAAEVIEGWAGAPTFSDSGSFVGFLGRSASARVIVHRVDHLVGARRRHNRRRGRPPGSRASEYS